MPPFLTRTMIKILAIEMLTIRHESDLIVLGSHVRQFGTRAGMNRLEQTKLSTATSELARNMLIHANGGLIQLENIQLAERQGVRLTFSDTGPGIISIDLAMQDGYSTGDGLGLGLPGARRLSGEFSLTSTVGVGTTVMILHWVNE